MQAAVNTTTVGAHPHPTKSSFLRPSPPCRVYFHASPRPNLRAIAMASKSQLQEQLIITRPDDWHLHLREGGVLEAVVPHRFVSPSVLIVFFWQCTPGVRRNVSEIVWQREAFWEGHHHAQPEAAGDHNGTGRGVQGGDNEGAAARE